MIVPRLSDIYGRKPFIVSCCILHLIGAALVLLTSELTFAYLLTFLMGFAMTGRYFVGYMWLTENMRIEDT